MFSPYVYVFDHLQNYFNTLDIIFIIG